MNERDKEWWFRRGIEDARKDKAPIFRWWRGRIIAVGEVDWTEDEEHNNGQEYLRGYDRGERM